MYAHAYFLHPTFSSANTFVCTVYTYAYNRIYMCVCILIPTYVYIYTYICVYTHIHTYIYIYICIYIQIHMQTYIYIYIHVHTFIYIYLPTYIHIYIHECVHMYTFDTRPSPHIYIILHTHMNVCTCALFTPDLLLIYISFSTYT